MEVRSVIDTSLVADMTVREVERMDYAIRKAGGSVKAGVKQDVGIAAMYMWKQIRGYRYTEQGTQLTIKQLLDAAHDTRVRFIQQHIINYAAFTVLSEFYGWLCDKRLMNRAAEGFWRKAERCFEDYRKVQKSFTEPKTWMLFLDHMRLSFDAISPQVALLETSVRDYLIQHRQDIIDARQKDDIAILQRAAVCFIFLTAMQHSYRDFFMDIIKSHGVDLSSEFRYAELSKMTRNIMWMCEKIGVKFGTDSDGVAILVGVNINNSVRVTSAWNGIVDTLGDSELLDETANAAINLNPDSKAEYEEKLAEEEAKAMKGGLEALKEKYKK